MTRVGLAIFALLFTPCVAGANEPVEALATPGAAPDIVRLKTGGMVRGTIAELDPNGTVVIVTIKGDTRTFDMKEVSYAGPAQQEVALPATAKATPPANEATSKPDERTEPIRFTAEGKEKLVTLHMRIATSGSALGSPFSVDEYSQVCSAPCDARMRPDMYKLALSAKNGSPVAVEAPIRISGPTELHGRYESYAVTRQVGWLTLALSAVAGIACGVTVLGESKHNNGTEISPYMGGLVLSVVGVIAGFAVGLKGDEAYVAAR